MLFVKFNVAACVTLNVPVVQAAKFDHVPVPAKNTGPKVFPPELIVFVPVPKKYTFIPVAHVPCAATMARLPYIFKLLAVELDAKFGALLVFDHVMLLQFALAIFNVTVWFAPVKDCCVKNTLSFTPGTPAPPAPPEVVDHFAISLQLPVPPTQ